MILQHSDLPPSPGVFNPKPDPGESRVYLQVFGYAPWMEELIAVSTELNITPPNPSKFGNASHLDKVKATILKSFPEDLDRRKFPVRPDPKGGGVTWCFTIASNKGPRDLERASDLKLIRTFQKALAIKEDVAPRWFRIAKT